MSHLQGGKVNIQFIQELSRKSLISLIRKCEGNKAIVWDQELAGPMGLIAQYSLLKEHGVHTMFPLQPSKLPVTQVNHIIFISRPKLHLMQCISDNVHSEENEAKRTNTSFKKQYHLFFVPNMTSMCKKILKHSGMYGSLTFKEDFKCLLFPYDSDLITLELPDCFREYYLEGDPTSLYQIAQSIIELEKLYGPIPKVWGKGTTAKQVWELVKRLQRESSSEINTETRTHERPCIDQLLLIDRSVDMITPLATQLTYEGLIDEIYGISNCTGKFPAEMFPVTDDKISSAMAEKKKKKIILNSADKLFAELRDKNFRAVGPVLSKQAKLISSQLDDRHNDKTVQEIKQFMAKLPEMIADKKALAMHTTIAEHIKDITGTDTFLENLQTEQEFLNCIEVDKANAHIEDLMAQKASLDRVLRMICLQCLASSGLKPKLLEYYTREIVQVYGIETLLAIRNLEKIGLLRVQSGARQYTVLRKALRLTMEDTSETSPTDISYVHSGYAPLSVRLAEQLMRSGGWKHLQDVLGLLPGPTLDETPPPTFGSTHTQAPDSPSVVLVLFIGGCTFAEVSALRFLSQQEDSNVEFVIATTNIINGKTFLNSLTKN